MRYVIYGAGAIGGGVGARLHQHGFDVTLIARGAHLEMMQREGLRVRAPGEDVRVPVTAVGHPSEIEWRGDEAVILTMKTQDTAAAVEDLRAAAGSNVPVFCAQNGVENERIVARRFARPYAMLIQMPSTFVRPGEVIIHNAPVTACMDAGRYFGGTDEVVEQVCADLTTATCIAQPDPRVMRLKYAKLLLSNLGNTIPVVCPPDDEGTPVLARLLRREARGVFDAAGIDVATPEEFNARVSLVVLKPVEGAESHQGSTMQSLVRGTGSIETDYLNGEVVYAASLAGIDAPVNRALQDLAARVMRGAIAPGSLAVADVIALAREYGAVVEEA